jgi:hypothetical protein
MLRDGRVLIAGGFVFQGTGGYSPNGFSATASAELYDPAAGAFSSTGNMNAARGQHVAALLTDGKVLVAGGSPDWKGDYLVSAEIYDPSTGTFTPTGSMISSGRVSSAVLLPDGRVFISQDGNNAEIYDPVSGTFTLTGAYGLSTATQVDTAALLPNGLVLLVGCTPLCTAGMSALFDPKTNTFSSIGLRQAWDSASTATLLTDGTVLFVEGNDMAAPDDVEIYDPVSGRFAYVGKALDTHEFSTATRLHDGSVLIVGGQLVAGAGNIDVELYEPGTRTLVGTVAGLSVGRHNHTATLLPDGSVLIAGGFSVWPYPTASAEILQ